MAMFLVCVICSLARAAEPIDAAKGKPEKDGTVFYDIQLLGLEGKGWADTKAPYDRLPSKAEGVVRTAVWTLSRQSAGMCTRFVTDAQAISARWTLTKKELAMPIMAADGVSGLDLYVRLENGKWHWLSVGRPTAETNSVKLVTALPPGKREYLLYLPLYNGVSSVEVGLPKGATLFKADPRPAGKDKPIIFYGTSITHGASATRPGTCHPAMVGRWFDRPVLNLGFSGNGMMEPEVANLLAELDPAVYIIDCLPNMEAKLVSERAAPLVRTLRKAHPSTPIVLVEDRTYADAFLIASKHQRNQTSRAALKKAYNELLAEGVKDLHYLEGDKLLGEDGDDTADSSHPTDLGFYRQAKAFEAVLTPILAK
jgi:hypothetical protein